VDAKKKVAPRNQLDYINILYAHNVNESSASTIAKNTVFPQLQHNNLCSHNCLIIISVFKLPIKAGQTARITPLPTAVGHWLVESQKPKIESKMTSDTELNPLIQS
jgi:hypothetical protein